MLEFYLSCVRGNRDLLLVWKVLIVAHMFSLVFSCVASGTAAVPGDDDADQP